MTVTPPVASRASVGRLGTLALRVVPAAFILILFAWPVGALVRRAVDVGSDAGIGELLRRTNALDLLGFTLFQAAASTVLALVVAVPMVWLIARVDIPGSLLLMVIVTVPFVLPTVVVGIAFRALLDGPLAFLGVGSGLWPILLAHAFLNVAVVARVVGAAWRSLDPRQAEAAYTLGAGRVRAFVGVVLPRLMPAVGGAAALVFLFCSTSFGVIVILGNGEIRTLETEIYTQAIGYFRIPEAVALSMLQLIVVVAALLLTRLFGDPGGAVGARPAETRFRPHGRQWVAVAAAVAWTVVVLVGPIAVLAVRSVRPGADGAWTLDGYRSLSESVNGVTPLDTLRYSLGTAALAMVIALVVGLLAAVAMHRSRGRWAAAGDVVATIPLGISAVTLGFGYLIVLAALPSEVASSPLVIPCVQALIAIPVVVRIALPALTSVPARLRQAAATLGAGPLRVFLTVELPMIGRSLCAAGGFAFVMALGEFGATSFLARADTTTLPVLIGSALNRPGAENLATAMAASMLLVGVTIVAVVLVEALRPRTGALL
ncbi:Putative 2-aminoethylphosphonate transport system permease protein PhnU [Gordonia insulae]|uniref:2-aminoethylphosphonate transport system permease protein PhnU n=1 Tax=Gordonia insulae TaxID=2420509 RepID=A0A3G8JU91_9ACTN|nr:Putative 2-aminoethylphosphonate transport system permease protein PhnU [Gordonia insulae]